MELQPHSVLADLKGLLRAVKCGGQQFGLLA